MHEYVIRVFRAGGFLRWYAPDRLDTLEVLERPGNANVAQRLPAMGVGLAQSDLAGFLDPDVARLLSSALEAHPIVRLILHDSLPNEWQTFAFERLESRGKTLRGRLLVERAAKHDAWAPMLPASGRVLVGSLLSLDDIRDHFGWLASEDTTLDQVSTVIGAGPMEMMLDRTRMAKISALVVIARGTESAELPSFRLHDGSPWELPEECALPPLVALIACGTNDGNLIAYGQRLLKRAGGPTTIIASIGRIDLAPASAFLRHFLERWHAGADAASLLADAIRRDDLLGCADHLCLLGRGILHWGVPQSSAELQREDLIAAAQGEVAQGDAGDALVATLERILLEAVLNDGSLGDPYGKLRDAGMLTLDQKQQKKLLVALEHDSVKPRLSFLARVATGALAIHLAEAFDHEALKQYENLLASFEQDYPDPSPQIFHFWSKLPYRFGKYSLAMQLACDGLARADDDSLCRSALGLLGHFSNLLLDLDLPELADRITMRANHCCGERSDDDTVKLRYELLDRTARILLRRGNSEKAAATFKIKAKEAGTIVLSNGEKLRENDDRELAWLLYVAAWTRHSSLASLTERASARVQSLIACGSPAKGNADFNYLLRALALAAWRGGDGRAADKVNAQATYLSNLLERGDPGPSGFAAAFMNRYRLDHGGTSALPNWETAQAYLEDSAYWLELAALHALHGERSTSLRALDGFQQMKNGAVEYLARIPRDRNIGRSLDGWRLAVEQRQRDETAFFEGVQEGVPCDVDALVRSGLLPL